VLLAGTAARLLLASVLSSLMTLLLGRLLHVDLTVALRDVGLLPRLLLLLIL
jgi:hypothetical protein